MPKSCPICLRSYSDDNAFCPVDGTTLHADVSGDLIGSVIADRYLITDLLGEGGMGRVYLGRHVRLPQLAAIKVLRPDLVKDGASISRFNREATSASRIQNEFVARVFDFGETQDNLVYIAMEYVPGRTLRSLVETEGPLPLQRAAVIVAQIAEGLDAAHRLGIVHRDLKPDNVIVTQDEELGDRAKVVDFGIAKAIGGDQQGQLTSTGFVIGTPDYMSPEQLLSEAVDARSDVYALGLVAYNMLTGALPFSSTTPSHGLMSRLVDAPAPLSKSNPRGMWSIQVQQVFDKVLARDINDRYAKVRDFAAALQEAAGIAMPTVGVRATHALTNRVPAVDPVANARRQETVPKRTVDTSSASSQRRNMPIVAALSATGVMAVAAIVYFMQGDVSDANAVAPTAQLPPGQVIATDSAMRPETTTVALDTSANGTNTAPGAGSLPPAPRTASPNTSAADTLSRGATSSTRTPASTLSSNNSRSVPITAAIDSVMRAVDQLLESTDDAAIASGARDQIQRINVLLRRANTSGDSARLYFLSGNASKIVGDENAACAALRLVGKLTLSAGDKRAADRYHQQWGCDSPWRSGA